MLGFYVNRAMGRVLFVQEDNNALLVTMHVVDEIDLETALLVAL